MVLFDPEEGRLEKEVVDIQLDLEIRAVKGLRGTPEEKDIKKAPLTAASPGRRRSR